MADPTISLPEAAPSPVLDHSRRQLEALLDVSKIIAQHRDLKTLFHELAERLHSVVESDFLALVLHDPEKNVMRLHVLETHAGHSKPVGSETSVEGNPCSLLSPTIFLPRRASPIFWFACANPAFAPSRLCR